MILRKMKIEIYMKGTFRYHFFHPIASDVCWAGRGDVAARGALGSEKWSFGVGNERNPEKEGTRGMEWSGKRSACRVQGREGVGGWSNGS